MFPRSQIASAVIALTLGLVPPVQAQSRLIKSLDPNGDGKVSRDELPEGSTLRRVFDGLVEKNKLDPKKTYTLQELEQASGMSTTGSRGSSSPPGDTRRNSGRGGAGSRSARSVLNGKSRPLSDLPEPYRAHDKDGDGQVGLYEWPRDRIAEFLSLDKNDDGFLTVNELKKPSSSNGDKDRTKEQKAEDRPESKEESGT